MGLSNKDHKRVLDIVDSSIWI